MSKNCIVSLATKNGVYVDRLARLSDSLRDNLTDGDFIGFINEVSVGAESHLLNPYSFKIHAIKKCIEAGYKNILWADTSLYAIKNVNDIFEQINTEGYFFHDSTHYLGKWCNDFTLDYFGITKEEVINFPMIHAGFLGFNFDNEISLFIFKEWEKAMQNDCFKGDWENHRHDMSALNCILYKYNIKCSIKLNEDYLQYAGLYDQVLGEKIIFKAQG